MYNLHELIRKTGVVPASDAKLVADDKVHRFRIEGEKAARLSGTYCITITPDGAAIGWVRDHRQGVTFPIKERSNIAFTSMSDMESYRQRIAAERERKLAELLRLQDAAKLRAQDLYKSHGFSEGRHSYLERKGIPLIGAKAMKSMLMIPIYNDEGEICNLQFISQDGTKRFLKNGKLQGCIGVIPPGKKVGLNTIYIVEGYATGVSVHLATQCAVALAFNAGNIPAAAERLKQRHDASKIIIAADNDQWSKRPDGTPFNAGKHYSSLSKADHVILPPFPYDHPDQPTDFNDWHAIYGLDSLRDALV